MGHVLSALAPALIHHPEPSSVSFRWRHPKQGELITAGPYFGQVASHPPDIHAGSGCWGCTQHRPPAPQGSFAQWVCSFSTTSLWCSFNRSAKLFREFSRLKGEGTFESSFTSAHVHSQMYTCPYVCMHIQYTHTCVWSTTCMCHMLTAPWPFRCCYLSVYMSSYCGYLRSPASPIIDFKWKVSHCACRGWRGKRLKWFLCVSRLSKAFHTGFYS